jgi:hypothetical protein
MRPDLLARLRATMRGEIMPEAGVTGVTGVTDVTGYASKSPELRRLRRLRVKNTGLEKDAFSGVTEGVTSPPPDDRLAAPSSLEDRQASVEEIYAQMEAERERRRDWHAQPVEGWRDGRLTIRNIARDETVVVDFRKWRSGR